MNSISRHSIMLLAVLSAAAVQAVPTLEVDLTQRDNGYDIMITARDLPPNVDVGNARFYIDGAGSQFANYFYPDPAFTFGHDYLFGVNIPELFAMGVHNVTYVYALYGDPPINSISTSYEITQLPTVSTPVVQGSDGGSMSALLLTGLGLISMFRRHTVVS